MSLWQGGWRERCNGRYSSIQRRFKASITQTEKGGEGGGKTRIAYNSNHKFAILQLLDRFLLPFNREREGGRESTLRKGNLLLFTFEFKFCLLNLYLTLALGRK